MRKAQLMSIVASSSDRGVALGVNLCASLICALLLASGCEGQDRLPPAKQLIAETLALCKADRESNSSAINDLAEAQCYLGDFELARKTISPYAPNDFFGAA